MEINEDQPNKVKGFLFRACYIARGSAADTWVLAESQRQAEESGSFIYWVNRRFQVYLDSRLFTWESCSWANWHRGILCDWLGALIWLSLIGPKLEVTTKSREADIY